MKTDTIVAIQSNLGSGIAIIVMESGARIPVDSGHGLRVLFDATGRDPIGKRITYTMTEYGAMQSFTVEDEVWGDTSPEALERIERYEDLLDQD